MDTPPTLQILPLDLQSEILERLSLSELWGIRLVCREWNVLGTQLLAEARMRYWVAWAKLHEQGFSSSVCIDGSTIHVAGVPQFVGSSFEWLTDLKIYFTPLTTIHHSVGQLTNITSLSLFGNRLHSLCPAIGQLRRMTFLDLSSNVLESLPCSLASATSLSVLDLHDNRFRSLPEVILELTNVLDLNLSSNLMELCPPLSPLRALHRLDLSFNNLRILSPFVTAPETWTHPTTIDVRGNPNLEWTIPWQMMADVKADRRTRLQLLLPSHTISLPNSSPRRSLTSLPQPLAPHSSSVTAVQNSTSITEDREIV